MNEQQGARLKKIRLEKGLSLQKVHEQTKVHVHILKALEGDSLSHLSPVYLKSFLKIYCKYLGVDPGEFIEDYREPQYALSRPQGGGSHRQKERARDKDVNSRPNLFYNRHELKQDSPRRAEAVSAGRRAVPLKQAVGKPIVVKEAHAAAAAAAAAGSRQVLRAAAGTGVVLKNAARGVGSILARRETRMLLAVLVAAFLLISGVVKAGKFISTRIKEHSQRRALAAARRPPAPKKEKPGPAAPKRAPVVAAQSPVPQVKKAAPAAVKAAEIAQAKKSVSEAVPSAPVSREGPIAVVSPVVPAVPAASAAAGKEALSGVRLGIRTRENCWISLKVDGKVVFQRVLEKGRFESWEAKDKMELSLGNAGVVDVEVNGQLFSNLGRKGQALKNIRISKDGLNIGR